MRGDAERKCLEAVQRCIFISSPDRKETAYTVSEDEFLKNHYLYAKPVGQIFFGMSEDDVIHFENLLRLVKSMMRRVNFRILRQIEDLLSSFKLRHQRLQSEQAHCIKKNMPNFKRMRTKGKSN